MSYHHKSCRSYVCGECGGSGERMLTQRRWIGGTKNGYWSSRTDWTRCSDCSGEGLVYVSEFAEETGGPSGPAEQPITFAGVEVDAPGFESQEQFDRAIGRALVDDLRVIHDANNRTQVVHGARIAGYFTDRHACSCTAGHHGQACKHRAYWIVFHDVLLPGRRAAWKRAEAQLEADRAGRKVA